MEKELYTFQKEEIETLFTLVHGLGICFDEDIDILEIDFKLDEWKNAFFGLDFFCLENTCVSGGSYFYVDEDEKIKIFNEEIEDEKIKIFNEEIYHIDTKIGYESLEFSCIEPSKTLKNKEILKILRGSKSRSLNLYIIKFDGKFFVHKDWTN